MTDLKKAAQRAIELMDLTTLNDDDTDQKVIDLCRANDIPVFERNFSLVDTYSADEAFLTGTFGAQTPVGMIDGRVIGTGQMGPMTERLRGLYKTLVGA